MFVDTKNKFFRMWILTIVALAYFSSLAKAIPNYLGLPPGPYCAGRYPTMRCCEGRQDECSAPILSTTCYCDDFCDRDREEDCCPDYYSHCKGMPTEPPPGEVRRTFFAFSNRNQ